MLQIISRETYHGFLREFTSFMHHNHKDVCFYYYGSTFRGDHRPEYGSDIDGGLILDSMVVTPKDKIKDISEGLAHCLTANPVRIQFNLTDTQTNRDGRFLSYSPDYVDYFKNGNARVLSGPDLLMQMKAIDFKSDTLRSAAHNFRSVRNGLLTSVYDQAANHDEFLERYGDQ